MQQGKLAQDVTAWLQPCLTHRHWREEIREKGGVCSSAVPGCWREMDAFEDGEDAAETDEGDDADAEAATAATAQLQ